MNLSKFFQVTGAATLFTFAAQAQPFPTNGLVAYYPFNGNATDVSGYGFNGSPNNVSYGTDRFGHQSSAAVFDGASSQITIYTIPNANFFPVTLSVWLNGITNGGSDYGIIGNYGIASSIGYGVFASLNFVHSWYFGSQGNVYGGSEGLQAPNTLDGNWHQIVVTYDLDGGVIYVDGVLVDSLSWVGNPSASTSFKRLQIGNYSSYDGTENRIFTGSLDDIRIYDRALTPNEVALLYSIESTPPPPTATAIAALTGNFLTSVIMVNRGYDYTNTPQVRFIGGGGSGALAFAVVSNGVVTGITVSDDGYGYTNPPLVVIDPPFISSAVLGIAPMSFLCFSNLAVGGTYQLQQFVDYYWANLPISFTSTNVIFTNMVAGIGGQFRLALNPVPAQAFATPEVTNGFVIGAIVTIGGSGYATTPNVNIVDDFGSNAVATTSISGGVVTNINIFAAGYGYSTNVSIQIDPPPAAAVSPTVQPVMQINPSQLAPYDNYEIQFTPVLGGAWANWNGGLFTTTDVTNSQNLFITNDTGFFRLQYVP